MGEEVIEIKPQIGPFTLNVRALWRYLRNNKDDHSVTVVAQRFLQLFLDHGITAPQIPRLIPQVTLEKLQTIESLLSALTPDVLNFTADFFGVRRSWLDGVDDQIYELRFCYKQPHVFFELFSSLTLPTDRFAVRALSTKETLNFTKSIRQPLALVLVEKIKELDGAELYRYYIYGDAWDWSHPPCRIQLKAMARLVSEVCRRPIPLHQINPTELQAIVRGKRVPHEFLQGCLLTNPSLEDFSLSKEESVKSRESNELPAVLEYISRYQLEDLAI